MPATLSRLGLVAALQNLFDKITLFSGLQIHYTVHGFSGRLDETTEIMIYRMVLELVNNVVKHADANSITVQLIRYTDHINVTVEDDGTGFDLERVRKQGEGIGLSNITSRMESVSGKILIDTLEGQGTIVVLDIPLTGKS
jgi:signal transduction histidine kinase